MTNILRRNAKLFHLFPNKQNNEKELKLSKNELLFCFNGCEVSLIYHILGHDYRGLIGRTENKNELLDKLIKFDHFAHLSATTLLLFVRVLHFFMSEMLDLIIFFSFLDLNEHGDVVFK